MSREWGGVNIKPGIVSIWMHLCEERARKLGDHTPLGILKVGM